MPRTKIAGRVIEVLRVGDDPEDGLWIKETLKEAGFPVQLSEVGDGEEALAFLRREGSPGEKARPDAILLDLDLPKKGGMEVLAEIRDEQAFRNIPVFILSGLPLGLELQTAYRYARVFYVVKTPEPLNSLVKGLREVWIRTFRNQTAD